MTRTVTVNEDLVRYVAGRLRWITRQGVEDVFQAVRDFHAPDRDTGNGQATTAATRPQDAPRRVWHDGGPAPSAADAEKAITRSMGFS